MTVSQRSSIDALSIVFSLVTMVFREKRDVTFSYNCTWY